MEDFMQFLIRSGMGDRSDFIGCTQAEVATLESRYRVRLPSSYREFLLLMGCKAGRFLVGTDCLYGQLMELDLPKARLDQLLGLQFDWNLPEDAFIFSSHQGYIFHCFRTGEGDDPPVYGFAEHEPKLRRSAETFSGFLRNCAWDQLAVAKKVQSDEP